MRSGLANRPRSRPAPKPKVVNHTALATAAPTPKSQRPSRCSLDSAPINTTVSR